MRSSRRKRKKLVCDCYTWWGDGGCHNYDECVCGLLLQKKKKSAQKDGEKKITKKSATAEHKALAEDEGIEEEAPLHPEPKRKSLNTEEDSYIDAIVVTENNKIDVKASGDSEEKTAMDIINEILNPPLMEFDPTKPYDVPTAVEAGDVNALQDLDERKIIELKEVCCYIYKKCLFN